MKEGRKRGKKGRREGRKEGKEGGGNGGRKGNTHHLCYEIKVMESFVYFNGPESTNFASFARALAGPPPAEMYRDKHICPTVIKAAEQSSRCKLLILQLDS